MYSEQTVCVTVCVSVYAVCIEVCSYVSLRMYVSVCGVCLRGRGQVKPQGKEGGVMMRVEPSDHRGVWPGWGRWVLEAQGWLLAASSGGPVGQAPGRWQGSRVAVSVGWTLRAAALCSVQVAVQPPAASPPRSSSHLPGLRVHLCIDPARP